MVFIFKNVGLAAVGFLCFLLDYFFCLASCRKFSGYIELLNRFKFLRFVPISNRVLAFSGHSIHYCSESSEKDINGKLFKRKLTFFENFIIFETLFLRIVFLILYLCYYLAVVFSFRVLDCGVYVAFKYVFGFFLYSHSILFF